MVKAAIQYYRYIFVYVTKYIQSVVQDYFVDWPGGIRTIFHLRYSLYSVLLL